MYKQPSRNASSAQIINKMKDLSNALTVEVDTANDGQRVDNFLLRFCKGVPRSHVYRILRSGEVRVNSRRVDATYRLQPGDRVRIPPLRLARRTQKSVPPLDLPVIYEDDALLVVDKPAGTAVHGGSGISFRGRRENATSLREAVHAVSALSRKADARTPVPLRGGTCASGPASPILG